jgi:hypothetical protein
MAAWGGDGGEGKMDSITLNQPVRITPVRAGRLIDAESVLTTYGSWFGMPILRGVRDEAAHRLVQDGLVRYEAKDGVLYEAEVVDSTPGNDARKLAAHDDLVAALRACVWAADMMAGEPWREPPDGTQRSAAEIAAIGRAALAKASA